MEKIKSQIYNELKSLLIFRTNELREHSFEIQSSLIDMLNAKSKTTILPPYTELLKNVATQLYLSSLDNIEHTLLEVLEQISVELEFNFNHFESRFETLSKRIDELENKTNSSQD